MTDEVVEHARRAWESRMVATGVPLYDFRQTTGRIERWEDWCACWVETGRRHEELADDAVGARSVAQHLGTAALAYHFGQFLFVHHPDEMREVHGRTVDVYERAIEHMDPPGQRVQIPYEDDAQLFGVLRVPATSRPCPIVILVCGLDAAKEELHAYEQPLLERGMATLALEGPGQGEAQYALPTDPAFERAVDATLEWLATDDRVDDDRVGMFGISMLGGYYTLRAAAELDAIQACVTIASSYDFAEGWDDRAWLSREAFRIRSRLDTLDEAHEFARRFTLDGVAERVSCPVFLAQGTADRMCPPSAIGRIADEVTGPTVVRVVEGGSYVLHNMPYTYRPQTADWLAGELGGTLG